MSERKQTPDVLADILGAGAPVDEPRPAPVRTSRPAAPRRISQPERAAPERTRRWQYVVVSCQDYHGWRPRYENGVELAGWTHGPLLQTYLEQRGIEGWELVAATSGRALFGVMDGYQLFFKRLLG
jgi:hypothetical protein